MLQSIKSSMSKQFVEHETKKPRSNRPPPVGKTRSSCQSNLRLGSLLHASIRSKGSTRQDAVHLLSCRKTVVAWRTLKLWLTPTAHNVKSHLEATSISNFRGNCRKQSQLQTYLWWQTMPSNFSRGLFQARCPTSTIQDQSSTGSIKPS